MHEWIYPSILLVNACWLGAAFWYFGIKSRAAAKVLVPKTARESPLFETMVAAIKFLAGMNLALALLAVLLLINRSLFPEPAQQGLFLAVFAVANASQFAYNAPIALRGGRQGETYWDVTSGPMLFIFVVDAAVALISGVGAAWLLTI